MAVKLGLIVCVLLAGLSARQRTHFSSDLALWTHAQAVEPQLARPAINLAVQYRKAGCPEIAATWLLRAGPLTAGDPREQEYRAIIRGELNLLETFGTPVCDQPLLQPYC